jgi:hypothetical protein
MYAVFRMNHAGTCPRLVVVPASCRYKPFPLRVPLELLPFTGINSTFGFDFLLLRDASSFLSITQSRETS